MNDGIQPKYCSLSYVTVDEIASQAFTLGRGTLLAKADIKSAYRLVPVHPDDRLLLAICWRDTIFIDTMLPFGLRSAPKIFNALADALEWVLRSAGIQHVFHYLDDFIILGTPSSSQYESDFHRFRITCEHLGVPLAPHMLVGPTTFLEINIDTVTGQLSLPQDKLTRLTRTLEEWGNRRYCSRRQLESLVGLLHHARLQVKWFTLGDASCDGCWTF